MALLVVDFEDVDFFTEVCFPFEDPGRSLLVVGPRFRLAVSSALSPTLALSDKSVSPFTLVTLSTLNWDILGQQD